MFSTKKEVDHHVRTGLAKLRSESERNLRGFSIGKMYFKVGEFNSALHYVSGYLSVRDDSDQAYRLQGKCYEKLKKIDKAISAYQRSIQLNPKQSDLLIEVCQLIVNTMANDEQSFTPAKLRYWCDFATSQNINHDSLFNLKQKLLKRENASPKQLEDLLQKEIVQQPTKVEPRLQIIKLFLDQNRVSDAFQYAYDLEMKQLECFARSLDWYTCLGQVVEKVNDNLITSSWQYWILRLSSIERQLELTLTAELNVYSQTATLTDCTKLLFQLDQTLDVAAKSVNGICTEIQLATQFLQHYRGQFCLHAAALIFKRETVQKIHWREIIKYSLPLLLLAYNSGIPTTDWSRNSTEITKKLLRLWGQEAAFRCVQSGRTLLSCVDDCRADSVMANIRKICSEKGTFTSNDELLAQIRQFCSDSDWRKQIFRILFTSNDQIAKLHSSHFIQNIVFAEPIYEIPNASDLDTYEEMAQLLYPSSLSHLVYLSLNTKRLADFRCNVFNGLNLSVTNLANCGAETLNQLDVDSFLYATTEQARVNLNIERNVFESVNATSSIMTKPKMLPFANIMNSLSTEEQLNWWSAAYRAYKNMSGTDLGEIRAILQYGIEAVRGVGGPKMDVMIYLRLGEIFMARTQDCSKSTERVYLEARTVALFRFALYMIKMQNTSSLEQFRKFFKYPTNSSFEQEKEINKVTEAAVTYLAGRHFRNEEYEECIDELSNIQLPFATYFLAESYRKMSETRKTPKKNKRIYMEKAKENLETTLALLNNSNADKNHSLRSLVNDDIKNLHQILNKAEHALANGNSLVEDYFNDSYSSTSNTVATNTNNNNNNSIRNRRSEGGGGGGGLNTSFGSIAGGTNNNNNKNMGGLDGGGGGGGGGPSINELTTLMNKMMETLTIVQDDVVMVRAKLITIEEQLNKKHEIGSAVDPTSVLDDYLIEDELQNQAYTNNAMDYNYNPTLHNYNHQTGQPFTQQRIQTPTNQMVSTAVGLSYSQPQQQQQQQQQMLSYNNAFYNNAYPINYPYQTAPGLLPALAQQPGSILPPPPTTIPPRGVIGYGPQPTQQYTDPNYYKMGLPPPPTDSNVGQSFDKIMLDNINRQQTIITQLLQQQPQQQQQQQQQLITPSVSIPNAIPSTISSTNLINPVAPIQMLQQQKSSVPTQIIPSQQATTVPTTNTTDNNPSILKSLPKNVVITNSDPLPPHNTVTSQQTLSVTIPSHHIKSNQTTAQDLTVVQDAKATSNPVKQQADIKDKSPTVKFGGLSFSSTPITTPFAATPTSSTNIAAATNVSTTIPETKTSTATTKPNPFSNFSFGTPSLTFGGINSDTTTITSNKGPVMNLFGSNTTSLLQKSTDLAGKQTTTTTTFANLSTPFAAAAAEFSNKMTPTKPNVPNTNFGILLNTPTAVTSSSPSLLSMAVTPNKPTPAVAAAIAAANDNEEPEFIPSAHFEPVIPLPDLVDTQTGEENEHIKFEHRAKLLRFVRETKEWKERGIGNIKVLVNKSDPNKVRLLMRREQIFKLCCNQMLTKDMKFSPMGTSGNVLTWYGQDFSENELQVELLAIRFKTADICNDFHKAVLEAQTNMSSDDDPIVPVQKLDKPVVAKPTIKNNEKKSSMLPTTTLTTTTTTAPTNAEGFGDKFKPASGSWTCTGCYVTNKSNKKKCVACGTDAPGAVASIASTSTTPATSSIGGFGDKFKAKVGSWECKSCYISNTADSQYCLACESPKDDTVPKKSAAAPAGIQFSSTPSKFSFGVPFAAPTSTPAAVAVATVATGSSSLTSTKITSSLSGLATTMPTTSSTSGGFSFGTFTAMTTTNSSGGGGGGGSGATGIFGGLTPSTSSTTTATGTPQFSFALNGSATKPNLEPKETFSFVFKPKSPGTTKVKSPMKNTSVVEGAEDVTDDEDNIEEENNRYFMPVIPLPDKIEVKTGEEDEDILYSHRTKLYRYVDSEWKERGLGDLKILKHKQTGKLRVVMRREQIFKICLNHGLTSDIEYNKKDDKSWHFVANDYSEGAVELTQFCLRFKTPEIAVAFKKAIDDSLSGELNEPIKNDDTDEANRSAASVNDTSKSSEQTTVTQADKQKLKELKLPKDFFDERPACTGCRGCNSEEFQFSPEISSNLTNDQMPLPLIMPSVPSSTITPKPQQQQQQQQITQAGAGADNSILKQSIFSTPPSSKLSNDFTKNIFGNIKSGDSLFGNNSIFSPDKSVPDFSNKSQTNNIFGGGTSNFSGIDKTETSIFGGGFATTADSKTKSNTTTVATTTTTSVMNSFSFASPNIPSLITDTLADLCMNPSFLFGQSSIVTPTVSAGASPFSQLPPPPPTTSNIFGSVDIGSSGAIKGKSNGGDSSEGSQITTDEPKTSFPIFGGGATFKSASPKDSNATKPIVGNIFGSTFASVVSAGAATTTTAAPPTSTEKFSFSFANSLAQAATAATLQQQQQQQQQNDTLTTDATNLDDGGGGANLPFKDTGISFATLASSSSGGTDFVKLPENSAKPSFSTPSSGQPLSFFGLSNKNDFSNFNAKANTSLNGSLGIGGDDQNASGDAGDDPNYDPHYDPIIALPDEIVVSTGEEEEEKLFGERAKLFRYDANTREWKERGVGELKILHHPGKETYRLLMRREQVFKCVLNHALSDEFVISPMKASDKAFCWATNNYADESAGNLEQLSVRFKNAEIAQQFELAVTKCISQLKLEPEDD